MFGPHVKKEGSKNYIDALQKDIDEMKAAGLPLKACQIFVSGPQNVAINFSADAAKEFGDFAAAQHVPIIVHNSYVASLWTANQARRPFFRMQIMKQLEVCDKMGATGFVIHLPNESVPDIVSELKHIHPEKFNTVIYMETKSTVPTPLSYEKTARLDALFTAIAADDDLRGRVGHCVDTAHLWSSGLSLQTKAEATTWLHEISRLADGYLFKHPPHMLMFHLNDAQNPLRSGLDVHEALRLGQIWKNDAGGLKVIIDFIKSNNLIAILERNKKGGLGGDCKLIAEL